MNRKENPSDKITGGLGRFIKELAQIQNKRASALERNNTAENSHKKIYYSNRIIKLSIRILLIAVFILYIVFSDMSLTLSIFLFFVVLIFYLLASPAALITSMKFFSRERIPYSTLQAYAEETRSITRDLFNEMDRLDLDFSVGIDETISEIYTNGHGKMCPVCGHRQSIPFSHFSGDRHIAAQRNGVSVAEWGLIVCPKCESVWSDSFTLSGITTFLRKGETWGFVPSHFSCKLAEDVCKKCGSHVISSSAQQPQWHSLDKSCLQITVTCGDCSSFETRFYDLTGCSIFKFNTCSH